MTRPFELAPTDLEAHIEAMVDVTFAVLTSQFLTLPKGTGFIEYAEFQAAYEVLKSATAAFASFTESAVWSAVQQDALSLVVLRTILGLSPPEWAELATSETGMPVPQGAARSLDTQVRQNRQMFARERDNLTWRRAKALVKAGVQVVQAGAPTLSTNALHRLDKFDTKAGAISLAHAASRHVPYAVLLYERYLGRPFASHRDSVSELVGDVMESAIEAQLQSAQVTFRKTARAERIPGFEQAPDFFVPTELAPAVIIEAKVTGDGGTARDKVARMIRLSNMRDARIRSGQPGFQLVACIDGRGFGERRQDMRDMLRATRGKVFTLATLPYLIAHTDISRFLPRQPGGS